MSSNWKPAESTLHRGVGGLQLADVADETRLVASRLCDTEGPEKPVVTPIYNSTTYKLTSVEHYLDILKKGGYFYSRLGNPTTSAAEAAYSAIEGGAGSMLCSSGMAAITTTLLATLKAGDHVVCCRPLYSGTHSFLTKYMANFAIEVSWVESGGSVKEYEDCIKPTTKLLFGETPANPTIAILDLEAFGALSQSRNGILTVVDSTYGTPYLMTPHDYGVDIVVHSCTKYLGGHSDVLAGVISVRTLELWRAINKWRCTLGTVLSPYDAFLVTRGIKTLHVRMDRHCSNAQRVAEFLEAHDKVTRVHYPGLTSHPGHSVAKKQMKMFGGMVTMEIKGGLEAAVKFVEALRVIQLAVSLGGVESLVEHPASMTHGRLSMSEEDAKESGITDSLIRISIGLEDVDDLISDLQQALDKVDVHNKVSNDVHLRKVD